MNQTKVDKSNRVAKKSDAKIIQPPMWSKLSPTTEEKSQAVVKHKSIGFTAFPLEMSSSGHFRTRQISLDNIDDSAKFIQKLKTRSYEWIGRRNFRELCELYSAALMKYSNNPDFYCNRSLAFWRMEYYGQAINDCNSAIELDKNYLRAYYRRAAAYIGQGNLLKAIEDFEHLLKLCPNSGKANCLYLHCKDSLNKQLFNLVLTKNRSDYDIEDLINHRSIHIEDRQRIPKIVGERVTLNFVSELMRYYKRQWIIHLHRKTVYKILFHAKKILKTMPSLIYIDITADDDLITICGDIHGQLYDLIAIIESHGFPSAKNRYLFNGNFIGKGYSNVEVALLLLSLKCVFPARVFLARGHHETLMMTKISGFENEVKEKYTPAMYELFIDVFKWLPLAHVLNRRFLVLHGGLFTQDGVKLINIRNILRNIEPDDRGEAGDLLRDILWSDPMTQDGKEVNFRGMGGIRFGPNVTDEFLERNELELIIRSHEYRIDGYAEDHKGKCVTVFSTPNYCNYFQNSATTIRFLGPELIKMVTNFKVTPHPAAKKALHYADPIFAIDI